MDFPWEFCLQDGYLCKKKFNGVKHKLNLSALDAKLQQEVVETLNLYAEDLKIVKYSTKIKIYFIGNHAYIERRETGNVFVNAISSHLAFSAAGKPFDVFVGC